MTELRKVDVNDARLNAALFRDYSMLSSAYLLEPCHLSYLETKNYGRGMDTLPEKLAVPLKFFADRINYKQPLLEYAYGYALYNWKLVEDPNPDSIEYKNEDILPKIDRPLDNLRMIRKFHGCEDENGFVMLHVAIDSQTHKQIRSHKKIFDGAAAKDRELFNEGLSNHLETLNLMNDVFSKMWVVSGPT